MALGLGFFLLICQLFGMGSVYWAIDSYSFLTIAFVAQICGGIGAGLNSTSSLAVLTSHYPNEREKIMSLFEASTGLGFLFGPLIGAGLYSIGGYILPFYGLSMIYIVFLPLIVYIAKLVEHAESAQ
jgi:MFS family permease